MNVILFILTTLLHYLKLSLYYIWKYLSVNAHFEHPSWRTLSQNAPSLPNKEQRQRQDINLEIDNSATMAQSQAQVNEGLVKAAMMVSYLIFAARLITLTQSDT
jgi:hypothetical protein